MRRMRWCVRNDTALCRKVICEDEEIKYKGGYVSGDFSDIFPGGN
jgi:hypothetical protein